MILLTQNLLAPHMSPLRISTEGVPPLYSPLHGLFGISPYALRARPSASSGE